MRSREYGPDLTPPWKRQQPAPEVAAERDLVVEEAATGFCGAVVRCEKTAEGLTVTLEDGSASTGSSRWWSAASCWRAGW